MSLTAWITVVAMEDRGTLEEAAERVDVVAIFGSCPKRPSRYDTSCNYHENK